jgi:integrase
MTWLEHAPKIKLFPVVDARAPYPLSSDEQALLFQELPEHLARMALFKVNTGCREQEVCGLKWEYEVKVPELSTSVFIIPAAKVKNGEERLVVLNRVASSVVESVRDMHPEYVFVRKFEKTEEARPVTKMNNTAWKAARERAADKWQEQAGEAAPEGFPRASPRSQAHVRPTPARRRRLIRRLSGLARPQERPHHHALLSIGAGESHRGGGQDLRDRLPQNSRNHMASSEVERRSCA